jgi:NAD(P)-dependent dehydrogenase (short-subunit alcohol dehydrogenase family)
MRGLAQKTFIVTGAGAFAGLGFATARRLVEEGAQVLLTDINGSGVEACADRLKAEGRACAALQHDVTQEADWERAVAAALRLSGRIDGVVNNAGVAVLGDVAKLTLADFQRQIQINLESVFLGCRAVLQQIRRQGGGGAMVNISSIAGLVGLRGTAAYAASKGGVRLMSKTMAIDFAADAVRVNTIFPGMFETDIQKAAQRDNPGVGAQLATTIPLGRLGQPSEIAGMAAFLLSDDAAYITGAEFVVDGGLTAQ